MKRAIISDIHGNLEALEAVMRDIQDQHVDAVYCLGDVIGYGPNPAESLDMVMQFDCCLLGNHDQAVLCDPEGFSSGAEQAVYWTRAQLNAYIEPDDPELEQKVERQAQRFEFLNELPRSVREGKFLFVHGSARHPLSEYVFPEDILNPRKLERIFELVPQYCFQGHTHVPGVFRECGEFVRPDQLPAGYQLGEEKVMINVGSVGQPRDGDPRASYVVIDGDVVHFRRIEYPVHVVVNKIHAVSDLDRFLGDRLLEGR